MKKINRGFTLIELLVVIAIIGILSAIVLASLSTARSKANDAKIQGQLSGLRAAAEIYSSNNNNSGYTGMCTVGSTDTSGVYNLLQAANYPGSVAPTCHDSATAWAATHALSSNSAIHSCVDSSGKVSTSSAELATGILACP